MPDRFAAWQLATRELLAMISPRIPGQTVRITLVDGRRIELPIDEGAWRGDSSSSGRDPGDFDPTPLQARIIRFLIEGPKSAKQMRDKIGGHLYDSPGGIHDLIDVGVVEKKFSKFKLTDDVGQSIAVALGDEEPEE